MNLYKISQNANDDWDTYDSAVVAAESESEAKLIHPSEWGEAEWKELPEHLQEEGQSKMGWVDTNGFTRSGDWTTPDRVIVEYIGLAAEGIKKGVIVSSFNAG
jgi:hypothetical protein